MKGKRALNKQENKPALRKPDPRYEAAFQFLMAGDSYLVAATKAGFTRNTAYYHARKRLQQMVRDRSSELLQDYKDQSLLSLNPIAKGESKLAHYLADNPQELSKHAGIVKQIKQAAGALAADAAPGQTLIQIGELKAVILQAVPDLAPEPKLIEHDEE